MEEEHQTSPRPKLVYLVYLLLIIGSIYLIAYHGAHLYTFFPLIFFLICPLMHLFHGHHHSSGNDKESKDNQKLKCH